MGCFGDREKEPPEQTQRWEYLTLGDFKNTSAWNVVAYVWLWIMAIVTVAVYAADTYTAVNLLAFDKWSSQIQPALDIKYSKWIFAVCILLSWALAFYEGLRALRVIRRGGVAESYMDPLAVSLQSMRPKGWKRFLVFSELTKSKKGADYVALFVYFAFKGAIRIILAEGPRVFVNGMTLYAVADADLIVHGQPTGDNSAFEQFWLNFGQLAEENTQQTVILCAMLFTAVIWAFSALQLIVAVILYLTFLWHYIPQQDGRLSIYCRRKIDRRLEKVVEVKVVAAIEDEERKKQKAELKKVKTGEKPPGPVRQPTLPHMDGSPELTKDDSPPDFVFRRQDTNTTTTTLPPYTSRPPTRNGSNNMPPTTRGRPGMPSRSETQTSGWSNTSYNSNAPLLENAGFGGAYNRSGSPAPTMPAPAYNQQEYDQNYARPAPSRSGTQTSHNSNASTYSARPVPGHFMTPMAQRSNAPTSRMETQHSQRNFSPLSEGQTHRRLPPSNALPTKHNTGPNFEHAVGQFETTPQYEHGPIPVPGPTRQTTFESFRSASAQPERQASFDRPAPTLSRQQTYGSLHSQQSSFGRSMPARKPSVHSFSRPRTPPTLRESPGSYEMSAQPAYDDTSARPHAPLSQSTGFVAFNPSLHGASSAQQWPQRSVTVQNGPGAQGSYFGLVDPVQRSGTAPAQVATPAVADYEDILDDYAPEEQDRAQNSGIRRPEAPSEPVNRAHTAGPSGGYGTYR
ncbi:hypothetical protein MBLNU230_g2806t1 [Neophaeotheca triangularis]